MVRLLRRRNNFFRVTLAWFCIVSLNIFCVGAPVASVQADNNSSLPRFRTGELLVRFVGSNHIDKILIDPGANISALLAEYRKRSDVVYVEPNYLIQAQAFPSDILYSQQWSLSAIHASDAWSKELLARERQNLATKSVIAIIDTGVSVDHPDLFGRIWTNPRERVGDKIDNDNNGFVDDIFGWDFVDNDADPSPSFGPNFNRGAVNHGTLVAGLAAAASNNNQGVAGVSWNSQIMVLRALDGTGAGDAYAVIRAIDYAVSNGADVINMSFSGAIYSQALADSIRQAYEKNVIIVAAAGNTDPAAHGNDLSIHKSYPVCYDGQDGANYVLGVASIDPQGIKSAFSSFGDCVDLVAPGENLLTTQVYDASRSGFDQYYGSGWSGTSLATPLVSGAAAIVRALRPHMAVADVQRVLLSTADQVDDRNPMLHGALGAGQLNVATMVQQVIADPSFHGTTDGGHYIVTAFNNGSFPQIKILQPSGELFKRFFAFEANFKGDIAIATGNVIRANQPAVVAAVAGRGEPRVRVLTIEGQVFSQFFAFERSFRGGMSVATGDTDGDGIDEIIIGSGPGRRAEVKIFTAQGALLQTLRPYGNETIGGVSVATGDFNADGLTDIVVAPRATGVLPVKVISVSHPDPLLVFSPFGATVRGGVRIAVGNVFGDLRPEIVVTPDKASALPMVKVFDSTGLLLASQVVPTVASIQNFSLSVGNFNGRLHDDIIIGAGVGAAPLVLIFDITGDVTTRLMVHDNPRYTGGVQVAPLYN